MELYPGIAETKRSRHGALAVAAILACCAIADAQVSISPPAEIEREQPLGRRFDDHFEVDVLFACDRAWNAEEESFGADRGAELSFGWRLVSIPQNHKPGRLEEPGLFRSQNPSKHVVVFDTTTVTEEEFLLRLRDKLRGSKRREMLLFVHGAITTFDFSSRRVGQIAYDIGFDGPVVLYSWPSEGRVSGYLVDKANSEWTLPHLVAFLREIEADSGAERIHILSHSMGVNLVGRAIRELVRTDPSKWGGVFDQVVLAAGDMDVEVFARDFAPHVSCAARRVTIYVSDRDRALAGSRKLHKYPRLGDGAQTSEITENLSNIDLVDVSAVAEDWAGHEYYGGNPRVLEEFRGVLSGATTAERGLKRENGLYQLLPKEDDD